MREGALATMNGGGRIDRRVARTRALLQDALIALIPEQGYAAVTVEDICERANVGRSTFYLHYADKEALRAATMEAHLRAIVPEPGPPGERRLAFSGPMFAHARSFQPLHRALFAGGGDAIPDEIRERILRSVRQELARTGVPEGVPPEAVARFLAGAFLAVLGWWIEEGSAISAAEVDDLFQRLAGAGVG
jgi:AcrR family transcriptional regulator